MNRTRRIGIVVLVVLSAAAPARALIITPLYDSTVTALPYATQVETAVNYAIGQFESLYSDPITIKVVVSAAALGDHILGEASPDLDGPFTYARVRNALIAGQTTANDATAVASLSATDPTGGTPFYMLRAEAQALRLDTANSPYVSGTFTFSTSQNFTFDPANRAVAGEYDFIGTAEHEISHIMGRFSGLSAPSYLFPFDLFRYSGPGARSLTSGNANDYFSIDGGVTSLKVFDNTLDPADWAANQGADSFNAYSSSGVVNDLTPVDKTLLDVLGYHLVPEPSSQALFTGGIVLLLTVVRKRTGRRQR